MNSIQSLEELEKENAILKAKIEELTYDKQRICQIEQKALLQPIPPHDTAESLKLEEYIRYGRQMIVPTMGLEAQLKLKNAKVLVIGAGGLGCPALLYLTSAGIGLIGIMDGDTIDESNLPRQILYSKFTTGILKVDSARERLRKSNPLAKIVSYPFDLSPKNALQIIECYDVVLDCTDNQYARYLISDSCVVLKKPLISGAALQLDGQLTIYNYKNGPCFRCLHPEPSHAVAQSCADMGILGPVVGIIGVYQALEAIKLITRPKDSDFEPFILILSAISQTPTTKVIKLRRKDPKCPACGSHPNVSRHTIQESTPISNKFYFPANLCLDNELSEGDSKLLVSVKDLYHAIISLSPSGKIHLVDVRNEVQYGICSLPSSINIPLDTILYSKELPEAFMHMDSERPIYIICRRGRTSLIATKFLREKLDRTNIYSVSGGITEWSERIDREFPKY